MSSAAKSRAVALLQAAIDARVFPAAAAEVGNSNGPLWRHAAGTLTFDIQSAAFLDTIFDLASLTKPLATTSLVLQQSLAGTLRLDEPIGRGFPDWYGADRAAATVQD